MKSVSEIVIAGSGARPASTTGKPDSVLGRSDPMRRFLPTPYSAGLPVMGRTIRLETNNRNVRRQMLELFAPYAGSSKRSPEFLWRIVVDSSPSFSQPWPRRSVFSGHGLRFAQFGQSNFLAVDLAARQAVAFVAEGLVEDAQGFASPFVDTLFYMTSASLGLVPLACACVARKNEGILILGPANQGKTTASYLAAKDGLTFHADQAVFLEIADGRLRAWSDFVPLAFRPETLQHLPELAARTHLFSYRDFSFYYMPKEQLRSRTRAFVFPIGCVILERGACRVPRLTLIRKTAFRQCLPTHIAFRDDDRFESQHRTVLEALAQLPAYHIAYGSDPASAVPFFRDLITTDDGRDPAELDTN
jgi:hypothetical protein